jgi:hypothetical protein
MEAPSIRSSSDGMGDRRGQPRTYSVYGLRVRSAFPLPCDLAVRASRWDVDLRKAEGDRPARAGARTARAGPRFRRSVLGDGTQLLRWSGLLEGRVSPDGRRIDLRPLGTRAGSELPAGLLGPVLSFALIARGAEPFHATAVASKGEAIAFLGESGAGKSTLAAAFAATGFSLLTDDVLVLRPRGGRHLALPGPARLKLYPDAAKTLLRGASGPPLYAGTTKSLFEAPGRGRPVRPAPLLRIYLLAPLAAGRRRRAIAEERIAIDVLPRRDAFLAILRSSFNALPGGCARNERLFRLAADLSRRIPVKVLRYPRSFAALPRVRDAILRDLRGDR